MKRYFRSVDDPRLLLEREREPVTGRMVPKARSKREPSSQVSQGSTIAGIARTGIPIGAVVAGVAAVVLVVGAVAVAMSSGSGSNDSAATATALPNTTVAPAAVPPTADATAAGVVVTDPPVITTAPASTAPIEVVPAAIRLTSAAAATAAAIIPTDPAAQSTYSGPLPTFPITLDCTELGCSFSLRSFAPGTVTDDGSTSIQANAGRFVSTTTTSSPCTTSSGATISRQVARSIDLSLSGSQVVDGVSVPQLVSGTYQTVTPDAGYVPKVGDVVDEDADIGCPGQTLIFTIAGTLAPAN